MARRRKSNRRHRRGRFAFLYKLLSILLICGAILAALTLFFRVDTVVVTGEKKYTEQEILDASGVKARENLFLLNKYDLANRLLQALPYIEEVRINRKLPDTLLISVTECDATLAVVQDGTAWLVSPDGKIVDSMAPAEAAGQPTVDGVELLAPSVGSRLALGTEYAVRQQSLLDLLSALEAAGAMDQVQAIHLGDAAMLTMEFADRFTVDLPYGADYAYKLRVLQDAVIAKLETNQTGTVDLMDDERAYFRQS